MPALAPRKPQTARPRHRTPPSAGTGNLDDLYTARSAGAATTATTDADADDEASNPHITKAMFDRMQRTLRRRIRMERGRLQRERARLREEGVLPSPGGEGAAARRQRQRRRRGRNDKKKAQQLARVYAPGAASRARNQLKATQRRKESKRRSSGGDQQPPPPAPGQACDNCGQQAQWRCATCSEQYCSTCDRVLHLRPPRSGHARASLSAVAVKNGAGEAHAEGEGAATILPSIGSDASGSLDEWRPQSRGSSHNSSEAAFGGSDSGGAWGRKNPFNTTLRRRPEGSNGQPLVQLKQAGAPRRGLRSRSRPRRRSKRAARKSGAARGRGGDVNGQQGPRHRRAQSYGPKPTTSASAARGRPTRRHHSTGVPAFRATAVAPPGSAGSPGERPNGDAGGFSAPAMPYAVATAIDSSPLSSPTKRRQAAPGAVYAQALVDSPRRPLLQQRNVVRVLDSPEALSPVSGSDHEEVSSPKSVEKPAGIQVTPPRMSPASSTTTTSASGPVAPAFTEAAFATTAGGRLIQMEPSVFVPPSLAVGDYATDDSTGPMVSTMRSDKQGAAAASPLSSGPAAPSRVQRVVEVDRVVMGPTRTHGAAPPPQATKKGFIADPPLPSSTPQALSGASPPLQQQQQQLEVTQEGEEEEVYSSDDTGDEAMSV